MRILIALAQKDLRLLLRVKAGVFFTFVWPLVVAILFGTAFGGQSPSGPAKLGVAVVDEDGTDHSRAFLDALERSGDFTLARATLPEAEALVRRGRRAAYVVIKPGFAAASQQMFAGPPRDLALGIDPARQAEASLIEGLLTKHVMADVQSRLSGPAKTWTPVRIARAAVARERAGPANAFEVTFPQGIMWGIIGCVMSFAIGLVSERVHGTFVRLQTAPITRTQILSGKALACFASISLLQVVLLAIGVTWFGVRPSSYPLLALACGSASIALSGS